MIDSLSIKLQNKHNIVLNYARYLAESIKSDYLISINGSGKEIPEGLLHNYKTLNLNDDIEQCFKNEDLYRNSVVVFFDSEDVNKVGKSLSEIPFILMINSKKTTLIKNLEDNNLYSQFTFKIDEVYVALSGKYVDIKKVDQKKVIAAVSTYNDEDIIGQVMEHLLSQGVDILVVDNWSNDRTLQIVEGFKITYPERVYSARLPEDRPAELYEWKEILHYKATNTISKKYDWIIHYDSDEIRISPWLNNNLQESISFIDSLGFNAAAFTVLNFRPTQEGFNSENNPEEYFEYFEFGDQKSDLLQVKAWKNFGQEVDIKFHFGHDILFKNKKVFPVKFLLKHYPLRSTNQATQKIFKDRLPRFKKDEKSKGVDIHYDAMKEERSFIWEKQGLINYESNKNFYNQYFIQATSGINIPIQDKTAVILGFLRPQNEEILIEAIKRVQEQTFRNFDIYIYDNSAVPNALEKTRQLFPDVKIKVNNANLGFAGGNNSVMREVLKNGGYEYVVLLNDDTQVDLHWLQNLINSAKTDKKIGSVTSKLLFFEPYVRLKFTTPTFNPLKQDISNDSRDLGVKLYSSTRFKNTEYPKKFYREGCYGFEGDFTWTKDRFVIDIPTGSRNEEDKYTLILKVHSNGNTLNQKLNLRIANFEKTIALENDKEEYLIEVPKDIIENNKFNLIQSAGSGITAQFKGYDIGNVQAPGEVSSNAEIDKGQYDKPREVEMFCGGAALFKVDVLREVGIFDEYFFTYYEDSDLSLRIRKAGYKIQYEPTAVVRHMHATSTNENSLFFRYHWIKNRLAFVLKNFGIRPNIYTTYDNLKDTLSLLREVIRNRFKNNHYNQLFKTNIKSILIFTVNIPSLLLKRFNIIKCD